MFVCFTFGSSVISLIYYNQLKFYYNKGEPNATLGVISWMTSYKHAHVAHQNFLSKGIEKMGLGSSKLPSSIPCLCTEY
jgi:hypothetical protein